MYIGVYAYGESRFDLTFNPCDANIASLCPMNASVPIEASGIIPVAESDVSNIPAIALTIPDFEGEAILRIFANSTESEIGCYSAVVTNGATFSQPASVGTVLGVFTLIAVIASFATAIYGDSIPVVRTHYAHSLSVFVVFAVFQHIFYTGALSMNWPSVLVAWWSNFAWAGGMIHSGTMQSSINRLIGNNVGNTSEVGAAGSGTTQETLGGGYDISQIYKRDFSHIRARDVASEIYNDYVQDFKHNILRRNLEQQLQRRDLVNSSTGYSWYGKPVGVGLPLPGNYSGFAGTLAEEGIRVSNAFMTGFLWLLILLVILVAAVVVFKWLLEAFVMIRLLKKERLTFFRQHWLGYAALVALRTCFIAFFMMMFLTMFQFTYSSSGGVKAVAAIVFVIFFVGIAGLVSYAVWYRAQSASKAGHGHVTVGNLEKLIPRKNRQDHEREGRDIDPNAPAGQPSHSIPIWRLSILGEEPTPIHEDEDYTRKFGWLASRFRRSRWWFFAAWTLYEFIRACFYAGASGHPMTQVFGLLVVEFLAFGAVIWARPFEGMRLNIIVVYLLGFSKVATVALSAAFDIQFNLQRITTTVIGIVIIVIQGVLTIVTLIAIAVGAISSYMSVTRNHEDFRPRKWAGIREKYFRHIAQAATDQPPPPPPEPVYEEPKEPYFSVSGVRRQPKIEDEDPDFVAELAGQEMDPAASSASLARPRAPTPGPEESVTAAGTYTPTRRSRAFSTQSMMSNTNLPFGARQHRPSWSSRDFSDWHEERAGTPINMNKYVPDDESGYATPTGNGKKATRPSRSSTLPVQKVRPVASLDSLKVGGKSSTSDVIGAVPAPVVRPRSGTFSGSRAPSRSGTPTHSMYGAPVGYLDAPEQRVSSRHSAMLLTPAEEKDEELSRQPSKSAQ